MAFGTLGLGRHRLDGPSGGGMFQELLVLVTEEFAGAPVPAVVQQVAMACLKEHRGLLRGEVLGPAGVLVDGTRMEALFVASPVYFPDEFATVVEDGREIRIVWLVPITGSEAAFVRERGSDAFEDLLMEADPNLMDLSRKAVV
ncbi:suppressor of fused domain protein [Kribbella sp. NBC_01505]|uniref:suppressor of fused domain protein n=1 Tax=Kribbella sp. NBC_01505 TaxID=2903580 RepID=UPI00386D2C08